MNPNPTTTTLPRGGLAAWAAKPLLDRLLGAVTHGELQVELPDGQRLAARGTRPGPQAAIALHRWRPLARLALHGDIGLAESYRDGDWSTPDLTALLEFGDAHASAWAGRTAPRWPVRAAQRLAHLANANTRAGSRRNIAFHYDLGNAFYAQWLDPALIYSSALYAEPGQTLEAAQAAKLDRILALLQLDALAPDAPVLEIGCGWGALALAMAARHPGPVTGLTLSTEQLAHARARVGQQGLAGRVDLRLQDYRDVDGRYERIVSIEMIEAVGEAYWPTYFETLARRLAPGGIAVIQAITIADEHFESYRSGADFIQRCIFPGGMLPSPTALRSQAARAGLRLEHVETFGPSYAQTLREWRRRFRAAAPALDALGYDAAFRRLWDYYLAYCEAGFLGGKVDVGFYVYRHAAG